MAVICFSPWESLSKILGWCLWELRFRSMGHLGWKIIGCCLLPQRIPKAPVHIKHPQTKAWFSMVFSREFPHHWDHRIGVFHMNQGWDPSALWKGSMMIIQWIHKHIWLINLATSPTVWKWVIQVSWTPCLDPNCRFGILLIIDYNCRVQWSILDNPQIDPKSSYKIPDGRFQRKRGHFTCGLSP